MQAINEYVYCATIELGALTENKVKLGFMLDFNLGVDTILGIISDFARQPYRHNIIIYKTHKMASHRVIASYLGK